MATWGYSGVRERVGRTGADAARVYRGLMAQPSWVVKAAVISAALAVIAIVLLLVIPAVVVFAVVLIAGAIAEKARAALWRVVPRRDPEGRKNVRVIARRPEG